MFEVTVPAEYPAKAQPEIRVRVEHHDRGSFYNVFCHSSHWNCPRVHVKHKNTFLELTTITSLETQSTVQQTMQGIIGREWCEGECVVLQCITQALELLQQVATSLQKFVSIKFNEGLKCLIFID